MTIEGKYDAQGKFISFNTTSTTSQGTTFGVLEGADPWGTNYGVGTAVKRANGDYEAGINQHTKVNCVEVPGLTLLYGSIVDVNQKLDLSLSNSTGKLNISIGHGTFPSLVLDIAETKGIEYQFEEHSFVLSHGDAGLFSNGAYQTMAGIRQNQSNNMNKANEKTNAKFVTFYGYTVDTSNLFQYNYLPKDPNSQ